MEKIKWAVNTMPKTADSNLKVMGLDEVRKARTFHESFPQYLSLIHICCSTRRLP